MISFDNHAFKGLDASLKQLYAKLSAMGDGAAALIALLPQAIERVDEGAFMRAKEIDKTVNDMEVQVDQDVAAIINKYTVMGEELRFTLAAVKISGTLERAADKIKNCVKRLGKVKHPLEAQVRSELSHAVTALQSMLPLAIEQILDYLPERTEQLLGYGASVQQAYRKVLILLHGRQATTDDETHILLVTKNIEQAADMAVEIMKISHFIHFGAKFDKRAAAQA